MSGAINFRNPGNDKRRTFQCFVSIAFLTLRTYISYYDMMCSVFAPAKRKTGRQSEEFH
jgi:hypothetical protein